MRLLRRFGAVVLLLSLASPLSAWAASPAPSATDLQYALKFRTEFGLNTDPSLILATFGSPAYSSQEFGLPLSADETKDLNGRIAVEGRLAALVRAAEADAAFGGIYVDQADGGAVVVEVVGDPASAATRLQADIPAGATLKVKRVGRSYGQLQALQERIAADMNGLREEGIAVQTVGIDPKANLVLVGLQPYTSGAAAELARRYGAAIEVTAEDPFTLTTCTGVDNCSQYAGGIHIYTWINPTTTGNCTSGFIGRRTTNPASNELYYITAGHCLAQTTGIGAAWQQNMPGEATIGTASNYQFYSGMSADVGVIKLANGTATPKNLMFAAPSGPTRLILASQSNANQQVGNIVCRSGYRSNNSVCGTITLRDFSIVVSGYTFNHQWRGSVGAIEGDSGGPVYAGYTAYGIESTANSSAFNYGTIDYISSSFGYRPCYGDASPCN